MGWESVKTSDLGLKSIRYEMNYANITEYAPAKII